MAQQKIKKRKKHYSVGSIIWIIVKYFSLIFFSFVALLPIVSCVITAFKTEAEYQSTNVMTLPGSWLNFQNFIDAFTRANMGRAFINSAIILVCVLGASILIGTQLAYVLNRFKFPGNGLVRNLFLFATLLPGITGPLGSKYNLICAGVLISLLPALIIFLLCQKQIYSGITAGAVKG